MMKNLKNNLSLIIQSVLLIVTFLFLEALLVGCDDLSILSDKKKIHGSGNYITNTVSVDGFNSIIISTFGSVELKQAENFEVAYTIDDNLARYVDIYKSGNSLVIDIDDEYNYDNCQYKVTVSMPDVYKLITNSAGSIRSLNKIITDDLYLTANSTGNIIVDIKTQKLHTDINSAGNMALSGFADEHHSTLKSAGNISAFDLETNRTYINISSAGSGRIFVNEYLDVTLSSVGSLYYKGHPEVHSRISSMGNLVNAN